jgi:hypothetical protein
MWLAAASKQLYHTLAEHLECHQILSPIQNSVEFFVFLLSFSDQRVHIYTDTRACQRRSKIIIFSVTILQQQEIAVIYFSCRVRHGAISKSFKGFNENNKITNLVRKITE